MAYSKNILQNCSYHFAPRDESVVCMLELKLSREQMESEAELSCNYTLDNNGHQSRDKILIMSHLTTILTIVTILPVVNIAFSIKTIIIFCW